MNWSTKIDQQKNVLLLAFYMFIAMTLMVIRTGLVARAAAGTYPVALLPDDEEFPLRLLEDTAMARPPPPSLQDELDQLYATVLALLYAAELVARRLAGLSREIFELMDQADMLARSLRDLDKRVFVSPRQTGKRLDAP